MGINLGHLGDVVGGFNDESNRIRQNNQQQADRDQQRSDKVFDALANSDDPDIRAAAVTGLLTGQHPADGMSKWFGKVQQHPAFDQIKSLVADGHQPFMDPTQRKAKEKSAEIDSAISVAHTHGVDLTQADQRRMVMSSVGAAPPRVVSRQSGTIKFADGHEEPGSFDPETSTYYDQTDQPVYDAQGFTYHGRVGGTGSPSTGGKWTTVQDKNSPTGFSSVHVDATGKEMARTTGVPAPASSQDSFAPAPQPGYVLNTKKGTYQAASGEPGAAAKTETPSQNAEALRAIEGRILQMHPPPKASQFVPVTPQAQQQHRADLDAEAKNYGYADYGALQKAIADATGGVGAAVATPPPAPPVAQPTPARGKKVGSRSGLDIDAIRAQLAKDHGGQ